MSNKVDYSINVKEGNELIDNIKKINPNIGAFCGKFELNNITLAASADGCGSKIDLVNKYNMLN